MNRVNQNSDIKGMIRRVKPQPRRNVIKREVLSTEFIFPKRLKPLPMAQPIETVTATIPATIKADNWIETRFAHSDLFGKRFYSNMITFAVGALALVLFLNTFVYLYSAKDASGEILGLSTSAYEDLGSAGQSLEGRNLTDAESLFKSAQANLVLAQSKLETYKTLKLIAPQAKSADAVLRGAYELAQAGQKLTSALAIFDEFKLSSKGMETPNFYAKLAANKMLLGESVELLKKAKADFDDAGDLPGEYAETLNSAKQQVSMLDSMLSNLVALEDFYLSFVGDKPKTYLFVFQNYDELRATGGFIGTYGVTKLQNGGISSMKIQSVYNLDGNIFDKVAAPGPFHPDISKWGMRDANWFADFRLSASKLLYFFEKGGETADGVVAMTPKFFEDVLALTGPISMPAYKVTLTQENFQDVVQQKTSVEFDKKLNQPKKFLDELAPIMLDRMSSLDRQQWFKLLEIMQSNLTAKNIMVYSTDGSVQKKIENLGFAGDIKQTDKDYLAIINSNLGGTKTDLDIKQKIELKSKILSDGSIINTLIIKRENTSDERNKSFARIMVPQGSTLIAASGFDEGKFQSSAAEGARTDQDLQNWDRGELRFEKVFVRSESQKSEFSGWSILEAGQSKEITVVYSLPFRLQTGMFGKTDVYSLLFQRQPGVRDLEFKSTLEAGSWKKRWVSSNVQENGNNLELRYNSSADQFWGIVLTK